MSKIKNGGLDQYVAGPFEQQQFGTAGVLGVKGKEDYREMVQGPKGRKLKLKASIKEGQPVPSAPTRGSAGEL